MHLSSEQSKKFTGGNYIVARLFKLSDAFFPLPLPLVTIPKENRKVIEKFPTDFHVSNRFEPFSVRLSSVTTFKSLITYAGRREGYDKGVMVNLGNAR